MEKYLKNDILDVLYDSKSEEFADNILKEISKQRQELKSSAIEKELAEKIKKFIPDEKQRSEILKLLNEYEAENGKADDFWNKMYYKLGVYDCAEIKGILQSKIEQDREKATFFDEYTSDFMAYLESNRKAVLKGNGEYKEISKKISKIKNDNPKVTEFLENETVVELSKEELKAILEILNLERDIDNLEIKETFKLGAKEMLVFFKQMNLL